jgi:translation initiation factor IF-3
MDYDKYVFEREKKAKRQHKRKIRTKEYSFKPSTEYHDIDIMVNKCIKNLDKGHRILFLVKFKQRQRDYKKNGIEKLKYIEKKLDEIAVVEKRNENHNSISYLFVNKPKD